MLYTFQSDGRAFTYDIASNRIAGVDAPAQAGQGESCEPDGSDQPAMTPVIMKIYVELTARCNLACPGCYRDLIGTLDRAPARNRATPDGVVALAHISGVLDEYCARCDLLQLVLYGGEPLLEREMIRGLLARYPAQQAGRRATVCFSITTNGTRLDEEMVDLFCERGVSTVVSLDGGTQTLAATRGIGRVGSIERALAHMAAGGNPATISATITREGIPRIGEDIRYLVNLPVLMVRFNASDATSPEQVLTASDVARFTGEMQRLVDELVEAGDYERLGRIGNLVSAMAVIDSQRRIEGACGFGRTVIAVSARGETYPCPCFLGVPEFRLAPNRSLPVIQSIPLDCGTCVARHTCGGACQFSSHVAQRSGPELLLRKCDISRFFARLALGTYARLYIGPAPATRSGDVGASAAS